MRALEVRREWPAHGYSRRGCMLQRPAGKLVPSGIEAPTHRRVTPLPHKQLHAPGPYPTQPPCKSEHGNELDTLSTRTLGSAKGHTRARAHTHSRTESMQTQAVANRGLRCTSWGRPPRPRGPQGRALSPPQRTATWGSHHWRCQRLGLSLQPTDPATQDTNSKLATDTGGGR